MQQQEQEQQQTAEQAADLAALQAAAAGAAPGAQPAAVEVQQGPQPPSASAIQIAALAVGILRPVVAFAVPSLRSAPDELWQPIPEGVAAVLDHYGASAEWMQSPWARLAFSLAPLAAFAAVEAMKEQPKPAELAAPSVAAMVPQQQQEQHPGDGAGKHVQIGAVQAAPEGAPA